MSCIVWTLFRSNFLAGKLSEHSKNIWCKVKGQYAVQTNITPKKVLLQPWFDLHLNVSKDRYDVYVCYKNGRDSFMFRKIEAILIGEVLNFMKTKLLLSFNRVYVFGFITNNKVIDI